MTNPTLVIVVAVAENGVIGRDNDLPWRLGTDLRRFKTLTMGKPMIVGRKNWEAIGRPLPGRETIVLTRTPGYDAPGAHVVHDWPAALDAGHRLAAEMATGEIVIAGGAEIYRLGLPATSRIHLTRVHAVPEGEIRFPAFDETAFRETFREDHGAGPRDEHPFTFIDLERLPGAATKVDDGQA